MRLIQKARSRSTSLAAPVGGWNARDSLADMAPNDAVILQNWWPGTSTVILRYGKTSFATVDSGDVETIMAYNAASGTNKLFAASTDNNIYNITAGGVGSAVSLPAAITTPRFQYVNFATSSGQFLVLVNGANNPINYDGTNWTNPAITGVDESEFIHVNEFKGRLWFVQKDTLDMWYLALDAIAGAATKFSLAGIFSLGGYIMAMGTWTIDAGYGVDDYAVFITSKGEVAVYRLENPTDATGIQLIGVWVLGAPVGRRCFMKYAGDLLLICTDGVVPLSGALQSSRLNPRVSLTDKIQKAMSDSVDVYGSNFGWQLLYFPKQNQLYLNVPIQESANQQQYVMNTITKNWCNFTNWEASCWEIYNDDPYFGSGSTVYKAWDGLDDDGEDIDGFAIQAFNAFGDPQRQKRFTMMRPVLFTNGTPSLLGEINVDFDLGDTTSPLSFSATTYGVWDTGVWDTALWGSNLVSQASWQGVTGIGFYGSVVLKAAVNGIELQWVNTNVVWEHGAVL